MFCIRLHFAPSKSEIDLEVITSTHSCLLFSLFSVCLCLGFTVEVPIPNSSLAGVLNFVRKFP